MPERAPIRNNPKETLDYSNINIIPLTEENLEKTVLLASELFPYKADYTPPEMYLRMSLSPEKNSQLYLQEGIRDNKYFIALTQSDQEVVGIVGHYRLTSEDPDIFWVDWFCVDKKYRNKGLGKQLLHFNEERVREKGGRALKVWTSDWGEEALSQSLYENNGYFFERMVPDKKHHFNNIYRIKNLTAENT